MLTSLNFSPGVSRRIVSCYNIYSTKDTVCLCREVIWRLILGVHDFSNVMAAFVTRTCPPALKLDPKDFLLFQNAVWLQARKSIYYRNDDH